MKLVTNGCSFTWGAEILPFEIGITEDDTKYLQNIDYYVDFRNKHTYTYRLHEKLKTTEYRNLAMGGSSNKRIIRTTLDYFIPKIVNNEDLSEYIAVIQWSEPSREEIYHDKRYYTLSARGIWAQPSVSDEMNYNYKDYIKGRLLLDDKNFTNQFVNDFVLLSSFLELHKISYVFCHIASPNWDMPDLSNIKLPNVNWLAGTYQESSIRELINDVEQEQKIVLSYPQRHPNPEGHTLIAEILYNRFKELYNL
jgi:hypothetical protein